jgi:hypothetical protein
VSSSTQDSESQNDVEVVGQLPSDWTANAANHNHEAIFTALDRQYARDRVTTIPKALSRAQPTCVSQAHERWSLSAFAISDVPACRWSRFLKRLAHVGGSRQSSRRNRLFTCVSKHLHLYTKYRTTVLNIDPRPSSSALLGTVQRYLQQPGRSLATHVADIWITAPIWTASGANIEVLRHHHQAAIVFLLAWFLSVNI